MNIRFGLERLRAVWWGMWGLLCGITGMYVFVRDRDDEGLLILLTLIPIYLLHRLTCWVISGFFTVRTE